MRDYLKRLLSQQYTVEAVADGVAALAAIRQQPPDLLLTDVMMPGLDGFGLLQALRADPTTQDLPIILLSARAGEEARIEGLEAGADAYLTKPFSAREVLARVEAALKQAQLRREAMQQEQVLRLEAELAKQQVETILSSINDGFYVLDRDWQFTYVNDRLCEIVGMERGQILGYNVWDLFPDVIGTDIDVQFHRALHEQTPIHIEYFYATWQRWYDHRFYPSPDGLTVLVADVTDRKQAEASLQQLSTEIDQQLRKFDVVMSAVPDFIYTFDLSGRFTYVNQPLLDLWQKSLAEAVGRNFVELDYPLELAERLERQIQEVITSRQLLKDETPYTSTFGTRAYEYTFVPLFDSEGTVEAVAGITHDITDRKQAEIEREQLLARAQAAREQAETANRIKDEFLAVLSHELRSPLNPILGWSKLLRGGKLDDTRTEYALETIERNAQLQVQLIDDLLDISRILSGKLTLNVAPVDLSFITSAALETVRLAAEAKALQIQTILSPTVGRVNGDAGRLQQVIWNLLSNAVKFTPTGGCITLKLDSVGTNAHIQVTDTGKGINPDFLPYVFEYFRQEDGATTRKFGGLGLGLAIVRQIVELHGGTVTVASLGEGQGATFTVQIPVAPQSSPLPPFKVASEAMIDLSDVHILVIDDDADSRGFVAYVLEQVGAIVTSAASGQDALQSITVSMPDLIISDIGMPEMDGYMLMQHIRTLKEGSTVPAIALTAYASEMDQKQALAAGFQEHLSKPLEPAKLMMTIAHLLSRFPDRAANW